MSGEDTQRAPVALGSEEGESELAQVRRTLEAERVAHAEQLGRLYATDLRRMDEIAALEAQLAGQVQVMNGEEPFWCAPLIHLFHEFKLKPKDVARACTDLAKARYSDEPTAVLLLSSIAHAADPRPWRAKWFGFSLAKAGLARTALRVLSEARPAAPFSESETRAYSRLEVQAAAEREAAEAYAERRKEQVSKLAAQRSAAAFEAFEVVQQPTAPKRRAPRPETQKELRVACIADEFTVHSFAPECQLLQLGTDWEVPLGEFDADLLLIESAWKGRGDEWQNKVSNLSPQLLALIEWCRAHSVPTVFWNKEDPVHFSSFLRLARRVDFVFTTDLDCIPQYKKAVGHGRVFLLPFAAQPALHNPIEQYDRKDAFNFAGSYYLRYPQRQTDFASIVDTAAKLRPVEIYDRNYDNPHPHYAFPEIYKPLVLGRLPFEEIGRAYKGYKFGINLNTIKQSQTMFARRVFELQASNTVVVSNFSRGMRLLFGDLAISSDDAGGISQRLELLCSSEHEYLSLRLRALRKVLREHTYRHRLSYVVSKVWGTSFEYQPWCVAVLAKVTSVPEFERILAAFGAQAHSEKKLFILLADVRPEQLDHVLKQDAARSSVVLVSNVAEAHRAMGSKFDALSLWSVNDYYGPNYLLDLALGHEFSDARAFGKGGYYESSDGVSAPTAQAFGNQYRPVSELLWRSALVRLPGLDLRQLEAAAASAETATLRGPGLLALDVMNYCRGGALLSPEQLAMTIDKPQADEGIGLLDALYPLAEQVHAAEGAVVGDELPYLSAAAIAKLFRKPGSEQVTLQLRGENLHIVSRLAPEQHLYFYARTAFPREDLNLVSNSQFEWVCSYLGPLDLRVVAEFQDAAGTKLAHSMTRAGGVYSLAIPPDCHFVRFGLRVQGSGSASLGRMVLGAQRQRPAAVLGRGRALVLTKQYPAHDDLYKYGFLHSRVRAYREAGLLVDVFRIVDQATAEYREFEGVDVASGDADLLDATLSAGAYDHVLVHLLDERMWRVLVKHIARLRVTVWVHGVEIQAWQRREFEFDGAAPVEIERQKRLSERRGKFWRSILMPPPPNLHLVFVSQYLYDEVCQDLGFRLPASAYSIIHNYIDSRRFPYHRKPPEQRSRVLSIRSFANRKYANDLSCSAICELSKRKCFAELHFAIYGDGPLFEATVEPLRRFANVELHQHFLTHSQIAALQQEYGVMLTPSRMDTQGVSRDEAMASGLVPVTNRVGAIPEFVDQECGIVVPPDDPVALADAIEALYLDSERFCRLSAAASLRVNRQSGFDATIRREIEWITARPKGRPVEGA